MKKKNIKSGWCIIIYGFSGAGKSEIAKRLKKKIQKKIGKTILIDGDGLRNFLSKIGLKFGFSRKERDRAVIPKIELFKLILDNNINIIYPTIMLGHSKNVIKQWDKEIKNLFKIYIRTDLDKIIKFGKRKKIYSKKNIVGLDIKPNFPNKPNIIIDNNFDKKLEKISNEIFITLNKQIKF
jgi:adenylylsulfate kinase-like enzyme